MKKIAILHFAYPPNIGGVEKLIQDHAYILTKTGYSVKVVTGSGEETNKDIDFVKMPELQSLNIFNPPLQKKILEKGVFNDEFKSLSNLILNKIEALLSDVDVVIVHNMMTIYRNLPFTDAFTKYANSHPEKKIIIWIHDHMYINADKIVKDEKKTSDFEEKLITTPLKNVNYVVISETFKKNLLKIMPIEDHQLQVIPNGVNLKSFLEIDDSIWKLVEDFNLLNRYPLILSPVNILERKNIEYGIEIVKELIKNYPNLIYLISGQPSKHRNTADYMKKIEDQIKNLNLEKNVLFISKTINQALKNSELHDLYDLADLVFYFSKIENFGIPILEAGATKAPVFTSNIDIFKEIGKNNVFLTDTTNISSKDEAEIIKKFLNENKSAKLFHDVKKNYNLETIIKEKLVPLL